MHSQYPFRSYKKSTWPITAPEVNALFGFIAGAKVPASFTGSVTHNGHTIFCLKSQPDRKHRMMTYCPICSKRLTVGNLNQHMNFHPD